MSLVALMAALTPNHANAFLFWKDADAAESDFSSPSQASTLQSATNIDPNPDKGLGDSLQTSDNALLAYTGPSGTSADVVNVPAPDHISVYVVRSGDTMSEIADMFGVSVNTIIWANNLSSSKDVHPGDTLIILPVSGLKHVIAKGETLKSIATKFSADATEIAQYNGLDAGAALAVGTSIIIPGGEIAAPKPTSTGKSSSSSSKKVGSEPYLGGSGSAQPGYYTNPLPGAILTQGVHGWNGVDLAAAKGSSIHAAAAGTVIIAKNNGAWNGGYGNYVVITHANGTQTLYAHMTSTIVSPGQSVAAGQVLGYEGATGLATGPHLHFEVRGAQNPFRNCALRSVCSPQ